MAVHHPHMDRISIHAPQWGATDRCSRRHHRRPISIHAPQWGATLATCTSRATATHFNPRTPVGCDRPTGTSRRTPPYFNPRTPVGCDDNHLHREIRSRRFQSTHPSGVRLVNATCPARPARISIHAPQWGATADYRPARFQDWISIHAPQWGATCNPGAISVAIFAFQSTHPSGVRLHARAVDGVARLISIHAPQWGATYFIALSQAGQVFQSTHPSGVRLVVIVGALSIQYFNPRTPVGCDSDPTIFDLSVRISIHAPQWGATGGRPLLAYRRRDFNPRTPVGCDLDRYDMNRLAVEFQSTHPSGVRRGYWRVHMDNDLFQSTHPSGVRQRVRHLGRQSVAISIHAPQWGATGRLPQGRSCTMNFNPRTPVGCDPASTGGRACEEGFQSTHPSGVRRYRVVGDELGHRISIHAPQWGATIFGR